MKGLTKSFAPDLLPALADSSHLSTKKFSINGHGYIFNRGHVSPHGGIKMNIGASRSADPMIKKMRLVMVISYASTRYRRERRASHQPSRGPQPRSRKLKQ
jgi:hypothetical protein